jgi:diguanylate cyclase (GGDEF)-like protein
MPTPPPDPDDAPTAPERTEPARRRPRVPVQARLAAAAVAATLIAHGALAAALQRRPDWQPAPLALLIAAAMASVVAIAATMWFSGRRLARRIDTIVDVIERTQAGDYDSRVRDGSGDDLGLLARRVNRLVSAASAREKRIMASALSDPLTGLPNRALLTERIRHSLAMARRTRATFAVAVLDLDRFKFINDTLGHAAGDAVLCEVARRLRGTVRESDTVARLGGDEFVLMLHGGPDTVAEVGGRILEAMKEPLLHRDQRIDIGVSIGVAMHPQHGADDLTLLRNADTAMYRAKRRRAGLLVFDGGSHEVRHSYLSMLGDLRAALELNQLVLEYQPKLDLTSGLIVGLEGLVRWNHPTRGRVPPGEFIPFAERTGLMRDITRWVLRAAIDYSAGLAQRGLDLTVAINVSAHDIEDPSFAEAVGASLRARRVRASRLCLEITESGLVSESDIALRNLRAIAALGVRLAVDDFGTGYATLKQLQQLPVNELKVDRSFVAGMNENRGNLTIVQSTIALGKQLGLRVTAEGVETVAELRTLAGMGCDEVQGYYLAKPMTADDVAGWVEMRHALYASSREAYFRAIATQS